MTVHPENDETEQVKKLVGYETTDADAGPVVRFALFLLTVTLGVAGVAIGFYKYLDPVKFARRGSDIRCPRWCGGRCRLVRDCRRIHSLTSPRCAPRSASCLHEYGWVDKNAGVVRIPIERAIDVLAERGLPHREAPPAGTPPPAGVAPMEPSGSPPSRRPAAHEEQKGESQH